MPSEVEKQSNTQEADELTRLVFDDFEARNNFVGLFDLLYKIDRRVNPQLYTTDGQSQNL